MQYPKIHLNPELTEYQKNNIAKQFAGSNDTQIIFSIDLTENLDNVMLEPRYKEALRSVVFVTDPKTFSRIAELSDKVRQAWDSETGSIGYAQELADALVDGPYSWPAVKINTEENQDLTYLENAIHFAILHSFGSPLYCFSRAYGFLYLQCKIMGRSPNATLKATFDFYEQNLPKTGMRRHSTPANAYVSSAEELLDALKKGDMDMSSLFGFLASGKFGSILKTMDSVGQYILKDREILTQIQELAEELDIKSLVDETTRRLEELGEEQPSRRGKSKRRKNPSVEASSVKPMPVLAYEAASESLRHHFFQFLEQELEKEPNSGLHRWGGVFAKDSWLRCGLERFVKDRKAGTSFRRRAQDFFYGSFMSAVSMASIENRRENLLNIFGHYGNAVMVDVIEQYFKADEDLAAFHQEREAERHAQEIARMEREPASPKEPIPSPVVPPTISEMTTLAQLLKKQFGIEAPKEQYVPVVGGFPADSSQLLNNMQQSIKNHELAQKQQQELNLAAARASAVNAFKNVADMVQFLLDANRALPELVCRVAADLGISPNLVTIYYGCGDEKSQQNFFRQQFHVALAAALELAGRTDDAKAAYLQKLGQLEGLQGYVRDYFSAKQVLQELQYATPAIEKALAPDDTARPSFSASPMVDAFLKQHQQDKQDIANLREQMVGHYNPNARYAAPAMPQMAFHNVGGEK